jgi:RNA polymerase sigma-70 factor (ECF subfamily)
MTTTSSLTDDTEAALIAALRARDERAFGQLIADHGPRLLAVASRFLRCEQDRDDVVQEAFISAFRAIDNFDGHSRLGTWLHRITVNCCLMKLRSASRRPETSIDDLLPRFDETGHHQRRIDAWEDDVLSRVESRETREHVRACIDRLPETYRQVLLLRDIEGLDTQQSADLLQCTQANVKTRLHRARQALRTLLEPIFAPDRSRDAGTKMQKS